MKLEAELKQLQHQLALVDLVTEPRSAQRGEVIELLLVRLKKLKIKMYQETGHQTPHVHVDYGRHNHVASYAIDEGIRLVGTLDTKYDRAVSDWIGQHRDKLLEVWQTMQSGNNPSLAIGELAGDG
jgi:hypothetical protein